MRKGTPMRLFMVSEAGKKWKWILPSSSLKEQICWHLDFSLVKLISVFGLQILREMKVKLLCTTKFVIIWGIPMYISSNRKFNTVGNPEKDSLGKGIAWQRLLQSKGCWGYYKAPVWQADTLSTHGNTMGEEAPKGMSRAGTWMNL